MQTVAGVDSDQPKEFSDRWNNTSFTPTYGVPSLQAASLPNVDAASNLFNAYEYLILRSSEQEAIQLAAHSVWKAHGSSNALNHRQHQNPSPILTRPLQDSFGCLRPTPSAPSLHHTTSHPLLGLPPIRLPSFFDGVMLPPIRLIDRQNGHPSLPWSNPRQISGAEARPRSGDCGGGWLAQAWN